MDRFLSHLVLLETANVDDRRSGRVSSSKLTRKELDSLKSATLTIDRANYDDRIVALAPDLRRLAQAVHELDGYGFSMVDDGVIITVSLFEELLVSDIAGPNES